MTRVRALPQPLPCRLNSLACLPTSTSPWLRATGGAADDLVASQPSKASREIRGKRPTSPATGSSPARTARRIVSTLTRAYAAASAAVISGTADDRLSSAPTLASRARRCAASGAHWTVEILAASEDQVRPGRVADIGHHQSRPGGPLPPKPPNKGKLGWEGRDAGCAG